MRVSQRDSQEEMELSGTAAEFLDLAGLVRAGEGVVQLDIEGDPFPYDHLLSAIEVHSVSGASVMIRCSGDTVVLEGGAATMNVLAEIMEDLAEDKPGADSQIDHYPDHPYLSEGSRPLIIVLAE
jgi:hypothetical protein